MPNVHSDHCMVCPSLILHGVSQPVSNSDCMKVAIDFQITSSYRHGCACMAFLLFGRLFCRAAMGPSPKIVNNYSHTHCKHSICRPWGWVYTDTLLQRGKASVHALIQFPQGYNNYMHSCLNRASKKLSSLHSNVLHELVRSSDWVQIPLAIQCIPYFLE